MNLNFKISVFIKEGRYKYIVENFYHSYDELRGQYGNINRNAPFESLDFGRKNKEKVYEEANMKITALINDLEKFVRMPENKKNDW